MSTPDIMAIKKLALSTSLLPSNHQDWLPYAASPAFICCIGAGPWRFDRRKKVQHDALVLLGDRDIGELPTDTKWFPLDWQNEMLNALSASLQAQRHGQAVNGALVTFVSELRDMEPAKARSTFYEACGRPGGTKVLSLYLRDFVGVPCFPIDRHVRRFLEAENLPTREDQLLRLFSKANVDPIPVARFLGTKKLDQGNPDWSAWPDRKGAPCD